jgi:DNA-binding XRE family transcriptional regulator
VISLENAPKCDNTEGMEMTAEEWRQRIGTRVEARRIERGLMSRHRAAKASNVSEATWRNIENGTRVYDGQESRPSPRLGTVAEMGVALGWTPTWLERLMEGREPEYLALVESGELEGLDELRQEVAELRAQVKRLERMLVEGRRLL